MDAYDEGFKKLGAPKLKREEVANDYVVMIERNR